MLKKVNVAVKDKEVHLLA
ncbi:hypothetical protein C5167_044147 [Papaver somniferum]|uniref:Uncharacterized protein n=1 Tax=Papaver somniferum TaxID=3469 RepID=A0A4Y7LBL4_PAPSO|nr:hypothetical protein C5167_044147 [Papaver somniferum]